MEKVCDPMSVVVISSTPSLTLPVERRQDEEPEWRRNEFDREEGNKNNDNKRKHQLDPQNIINEAWAAQSDRSV